MNNYGENLQAWQYKKQTEANIETNKKYTLADIELSTARIKKEQSFDIQTRRRLQRMELSCTADGRIIVQQEAFGEPISGTLPIKIKAAKCYCHIGDVQPAVLTLVLEKENSEEVVLFWNLDELEDRHIRKVFERQGILLGFGEKKEKEIRRQILQMGRNAATTCELPEEHGWYRIGDCWKYAFPGELTWKEVMESC